MSPPNLKLVLRNGYATSVMLLVHKNRVRSQPLAIRQELVVNVQHISAVIFFHVFLASSEQSGTALQLFQIPLVKPAPKLEAASTAEFRPSPTVKKK